MTLPIKFDLTEVWEYLGSDPVRLYTKGKCWALAVAFWNRLDVPVYLLHPDWSGDIGHVFAGYNDGFVLDITGLMTLEDMKEEWRKILGTDEVDLYEYLLDEEVPLYPFIDEGWCKGGDPDGDYELALNVVDILLPQLGIRSAHD